MIVFVSGLIGAGKSTIAKGLAAEINCPYYDIDEIKKKVFAEDPDFQKNMELGIPFSNATRARVYQRVIDEFAVLRQQSKYLVVDEVLHKRQLRHKLFDAAEEIFGDFMVVWVRADEDVVRQRLTGSKREGHILDDPMPMYESFRREFEDFNRSVIVCSNNGTPQQSIDLLNALIANTSELAARIAQESGLS